MLGTPPRYMLRHAWVCQDRHWHSLETDTQVGQGKLKCIGIIHCVSLDRTGRPLQTCATACHLDPEIDTLEHEATAMLY